MELDLQMPAIKALTIGGKQFTVIEAEPLCHMIDKREIVILDDDHIERSADARINSLAKNWSWVSLGAIVVAWVDPHYYLLRGPVQLLAARKRADVSLVPCVIFDTEAVPVKKPKPEKPGPVSRLQDELATPAGRLVEKMLRETGRQLKSTNGNSVRCTDKLLEYATAYPDEYDPMFLLMHEICRGVDIPQQIVGGIMQLEIRVPEGESLADKKWKKRLIQTGYYKLMEAIKDQKGRSKSANDINSAEGIKLAMNRGHSVRLETTVPRPPKK